MFKKSSTNNATASLSLLSYWKERFAQEFIEHNPQPIDPAFAGKNAQDLNVLHELSLDTSIASNNDLLVKYITDKYPELLTQIGNEQTPLHLAIIHGNIAAVSAFLKVDSSIMSCCNQDELNPLFLAYSLYLRYKNIERNMTELSSPSHRKILASLGHKVKNSSQQLSLKENIYKIIQYIISQYPQALEYKTSENSTIAHLAIEVNDINTLRLCIEHYPSILINNYHFDITLFLYAAVRLDRYPERSACYDFLVEYMLKNHGRLGNVMYHPLYQVCSFGNLGLVTQLIKRHPSITYETKIADNQTPAMIAAIYSHQDVLEYFIEQSGGTTASKKRTKIVAYLNLKDRQGRNILHLSAMAKSRCLEWLLESGFINRQITDSFGRTALFYTIPNDNLDLIIEMIQRYGYDPMHHDHDGLTFIHTAIFYKKNNMAQKILEYFPHFSLNMLNPHGKTLAHIAAQCGNLEFLEWLYTKNIKILATAYTAKQSVRSQLILPLDEAIMHGHLEVVSWFLEKGFTPSNKNPILLNALNAGHLNVLRFFLEEYTIDYKHLNINEKRTASSVIDVNLFTELHSFLLYAVLEQFLSASNKEVKTKHLAIMDYLFEQFHTKFDINSLSAALMRLADNPSIMALKRHELIIAWLLTNKKIKSTDLSPHDLASKPELIKNLIMLKVFNANSMLNDHTPLVHLAIATNNLDLLQYLATHHADLSIIDSAGMTVHQIALITKASEVSTWLLKEYPHNIHKKDRYNFTTLDYYRFHDKLEWFIETFTAFYGYDATIKLILEHHDITIVDHLINKVTTTIDEQPKIDYPSMLLTILCENDNIQQASSILEKTTFDCEKLFYDSAIACRQRTLTFLAENIPSLCTNRIVLNKALKLTHDSSVKQYLKTLIERHHPKKTQETLEVIASRSEQLKIDKEFILKTFFTFNIKTLKTLKEETYQEELKTLFQDCAQIEHLLTEFVCSDQDSLEKILKEHGLNPEIIVHMVEKNILKQQISKLFYHLIRIPAFVQIFAEQINKLLLEAITHRHDKIAVDFLRAKNIKEGGFWNPEYLCEAFTIASRNKQYDIVSLLTQHDCVQILAQDDDEHEDHHADLSAQLDLTDCDHDETDEDLSIILADHTNEGVDNITTYWNIYIPLAVPIPVLIPMYNQLFDYTSLTEAAKYGDCAFIFQFIQQINLTEPLIHSLINELYFLTVEYNQADAFQLLMKSLPPTEVKSGYFHWLLVKAASKGFETIVQDLLTIEHIRNRAHFYSNRALRWAASAGHLSVVQQLLMIPSVAAHVVDDDNYALRWSVKNGHLPVTEFLLSINNVSDHATINRNEALRMSCKRVNYYFKVSKEAVDHHIVRLAVTQVQSYEAIKNLLLAIPSVLQYAIEMPIHERYRIHLERFIHHQVRLLTSNPLLATQKTKFYLTMMKFLVINSKDPYWFNDLKELLQYPLLASKALAYAQESECILLAINHDCDQALELMKSLIAQEPQQHNQVLNFSHQQAPDSKKTLKPGT